MYSLVIGLEIHLKVTSTTKLFCACENSQDESLTPNTNICPICTAQPGGLPVLQRSAYQQALLMGKALGCSINPISSFDRKSYFYPDLPMGYQITQFFNPTLTKGQITFFDEAFDTKQTIRIRQIQMETDTAKSIHTDASSLLDYNRAGTPLIEIVTEPDFTSAEQAGAFLKELQRIARYNGISDANMELGQLRVDVNISVKQDGKLGIRNEIKNMNSISAIMTAIDQEYARQLNIIKNWGTIEQATRRRDSTSNTSVVMRSKEDALDYRYFPEPDLPELHISAQDLQNIQAKDIFLPYEFIKKSRSEYGFSKEYINTLIHDQDILEYFQDCVVEDCDPTEVVKWIAWPISAHLNENFSPISDLKFSRADFVEFLGLVERWDLISNHYKMIMDEMIQTWEDPNTIIDRLGLESWGDEDELLTIVQQIIADHPNVVEQYLWGKDTAIWFFVGQVMKATQWKADPNEVREMLMKEIRK